MKSKSQAAESEKNKKRGEKNHQMTESRSVICNLTRKITSAPEVNFHAPEVELSAQFFSSNYSLQFKI